MTVVGAGLAGLAAALSAARLGLRVALVHDRSVLGGNASKEVRLDANGACWFGLYRRESGLIEEWMLDNLYRNPQANAEIWDALLLESMRREQNIAMFFDTSVFEIARKSRHIQTVTGFQSTTSRRLVFRSPWYLDSSGDGIVAWLAGAAYMTGREDRRQFGEPSAIQQADAATMGNSLLMSFRRADRKIVFTPPTFAYSIPVIHKLIAQSRLRLKDVQEFDRWAVAFWWIEFGGLLDTIADAETIRIELERIIWGLYNYIKNSGEVPDVENLDLAWMQSCPGKRESRRFVGDYILTENDIVQTSRFPDAVAYGGWPMDNHPPEGVWGKQSAVSRPVDPYDIPLRTLYARDLDNLFLAGRDISVTHQALTSTRVMGTCAELGQAVGAAAYLCRQHACTPRELVGDSTRMARLRDLLIRNDATILNATYDLRKNLARSATVTASSTFALRNTATAKRTRLDQDVYFLAAVMPGMKQIRFKADVRRDTQCRVEVFRSTPPMAYTPGELLSQQTVKLAAGRNRWFAVEVGDLTDAELVFIRLRRNPHLDLHYGVEPFTLFATVARKDSSFDNVKHTKYTQAADHLCFQVAPATQVHDAAQVVNGHIRPTVRPNSWISRPGERTAWLAFKWPKPRRIRRLDLFLNPDFNGRLNNSSRNPVLVRPTLVRDYSIRVRAGRGWRTIGRATDNHQRWTRHVLPRPVLTTELRIDFQRTWGADYFEVCEVIAY